MSGKRFVALPDGWWRDTTTGLEWSPTAPDLMNWGDAAHWCRGEGGRLPTLDELQTVVDRTMHDLCTALPDTQSGSYWSASTYAPDPVLAWIVYFFDGYVGAGTKTNNYSVRAVRGPNRNLAPSTDASNPTPIDLLASLSGSSPEAIERGLTNRVGVSQPKPDRSIFHASTEELQREIEYRNQRERLKNQYGK